MKKLIVAGFGGQGVLSLGLFVSYAAMNAGLNVSWLPSYGPEMRGGTANCSVTVSDKTIASPLVSRPDVLVALNAPSLAKFLDAVPAGGTVFVNSSVAEPVEKPGVTVVGIPVDDLAAPVNPKGANIVMFGAMLSALGLSREAAAEAVKYVFRAKPQFHEANLKCLDIGAAYKG